MSLLGNTKKLLVLEKKYNDNNKTLTMTMNNYNLTKERICKVDAQKNLQTAVKDVIKDDLLGLGILTSEKTICIYDGFETSYKEIKNITFYNSKDGIEKSIIYENYDGTKERILFNDDNYNNSNSFDYSEKFQIILSPEYLFNKKIVGSKMYLFKENNVFSHIIITK